MAETLRLQPQGKRYADGKLNDAPIMTLHFHHTQHTHTRRHTDTHTQQESIEHSTAVVNNETETPLSSH